MTRRSATRHAWLAAALLLVGVAEPASARPRRRRAPTPEVKPEKGPPPEGEMGPPVPDDLQPPEPTPDPVEPPPTGTNPPPCVEGGEDDEGGDVTESISLGPEPIPTPATPVAPVAPAGGSLVRGRQWARFLGEVGVYRTRMGEVSPAPVLEVPHDRLVGRGQLYLELKYAPTARYQAVASGWLSYGYHEQDSVDTFNGINGEAGRSHVEGGLYEAYVAIFRGRLDLRFGQQRIAWGKGDAFSPNDVVNPKDLRDPVLAETELMRIPTPAVRASYSLSNGLVELVGVPFFTANRQDVYNSNWALVQPSSPAFARGFYRIVSGLPDPTLQDELQPLLRQTALPADDLTGAALGSRLSFSRGGSDYDLYYLWGHDPTANVQLSDVEVTNPVTGQPIPNPHTGENMTFGEYLTGAIDWSTADVATIAPMFDLIADGVQPLSITYARRHHVGAAFERPVGKYIVRADAAFDSDMVFLDTSTLTGVLSPVVQAMAALEYQPGELGKLVLLEAWYMRLLDLDHPAGREHTLLGYEEDNLSIGGLFRWSWQSGKFELETRGQIGIKPLGYVVRPQLSWTRRGLSLRVGALLLDGEEPSLGRYYYRNTSLYLAMKHSF